MTIRAPQVPAPSVGYTVVFLKAQQLKLLQDMLADIERQLASPRAAESISPDNLERALASVRDLQDTVERSRRINL